MKNIKEKEQDPFFLIHEGYDASLVVLRACVRAKGFFASGLPGGYEAVWARDSMITSLGAASSGDEFKKTFEKSIDTLSKKQSKLGQIPNAVGSYNTERRSDVTFNSIDSTLWYIVGNYAFAAAYRDKSLLKKYASNLEQAFTWLSYQDPNEDKLLAQLPTSDWLDAFPHKYGRTINTQALYYGALKFAGKKKLADHIRRVVNGEVEKYLSLYDADRGYYLPWIWKTHGPNDREQETWFDSTGNFLAIITGLATPSIANSILDYVEQTGVNDPYPCKSISPPIKEGDREWHDYFSESEAGKPFNYLNGGVWPYVGGLYVAALVKAGRHEKAKTALMKLAEANKKGSDREWGFHEWLHGITGMPAGGSNLYQGWSAGMYAFAYNSVKRKKVLYFR
ncbi:MAG: hypothetical protein COU07_01680 [Candidatus Harrisonbacteria bacterium CG10_big_fil_rev_8_21_14_0_10_40_38]|uniref:Glycogen debranching enzyme C-terminal domain-containing protein n=1 Tax=Candidatus Harrisonbacteria bacterium CG10_big_fil_rev_8_21_14_0_10_40_38 TaxID=1974583 RepID=A0A2H0UT46_9BACT|nr:MAG: hypothetical protein COU07_01680 [Candidatus Harrisonbacteria bacterium CG10_big_fil_rev_8_21_14_0_10_40_38]